ncbi:hypothetical protein M758_10G072500 [Ceratodon purpureus]|nr:hypothetical protein M758_10G072500 [Ceratodon purpureus]
MMNIVALAMLLSSLGSMMVLSPEPMLVRSSADGESAMDAVKEAAQGTFLKAEETVAAAKDTVVRGVEGVTKPVETSLGWFKKKPKPEDHLAVAREKAAEAKEAFQDASGQLKEATVEKFGSVAESAKGKAADAFRETGKYVGDKASGAAGAAKDAAGKAEEVAVDSAHTVYNKAYDTAAATGDKAGSAIRRTASRAKEGAEDLYDSASETFGSAKEKTYEKAGEAKDKVYEGTEKARDAVVENVHLGVDKTKGTAIDAAEKVKETGEYAVHETKETGQGIFGKVKDAACRTAECLRARAHEAGSFLPHVGQGLGYVYNDGKAAAGDTTESLRKTASNAAENAGEAAENAKEWTRDTARQSYDSARDRAGDYYQEGREWAEDTYDSGRDAAREYYDEAGRRYRSARDYYDGPSDYYRGRGGRQQYRDRPRDAPSRYYDAAKEEAQDFYDHEIRDRARYAYRSARDTGGAYYDDAKDRMGRNIPGKHQGSSRDYYEGSRRRAPEGYRGARDADEEYYERARFKPDDLDDLGAVVESLGWRRFGKVPKDHKGVESSKEVVIGDVKYVWQGKGEPRSDETAFHHMKNSVKGAAHTVGEKLGLVKDRVKEGAENVRDSSVRARDQAYDPLAKHPHYWEHDDDHNVDEGDESIITKGARNVKEGVRNAGQAYEAQRSKAGEYADEARRELSSFAGYGQPGRASRGGHLRSWKDVFVRKPVGMLLALTRALHLFTFSTVYGSAIWVTFVSGLILSKHVPRQQFGYVQSRMFPVYLRMLATGEGLLLLLHSLMHPWFSSESIERMQLLNFAVMIASTILNAYVVEPQATKVMFERLKVEKEEGRGLENAANPVDATKVMEDQKKKLVIINQQFKTLHSYSSALNLISLGGLTCHLWHLANRLVI